MPRLLRRQSYQWVCTATAGLPAVNNGALASPALVFQPPLTGIYYSAHHLFDWLTDGLQADDGWGLQAQTSKHRFFPFFVFCLAPTPPQPSNHKSCCSCWLQTTTDCLLLSSVMRKKGMLVQDPQKNKTKKHLKMQLVRSNHSTCIHCACVHTLNINSNAAAEAEVAALM